MTRPSPRHPHSSSSTPVFLIRSKGEPPQPSIRSASSHPEPVERHHLHHRTASDRATPSGTSCAKDPRDAAGPISSSGACPRRSTPVRFPPPSAPSPAQNSSPTTVGPVSGSASSFQNGSPRETERPMPLEQQPVNEYQALSTSFPFSWAAADLWDYCSRLALTGVSFTLFVGFPVAAFGMRAISDPEVDGLRCALGAMSAGELACSTAASLPSADSSSPPRSPVFKSGRIRSHSPSSHSRGESLAFTSST